MPTLASTEEIRQSPRAPVEIEVPASTAWPIVLAFGFTLMFAGGCALALGVLVRFGAPWLRRGVLLFLAAFSACYALYDIRDDLLHLGPQTSMTDADALARVTFIPAIVWGLGWAALSLALLFFTLRRVLLARRPDVPGQVAPGF